MAKMTAAVMFKSGETFSFECDEITAERSAWDGKLTVMKWKGADEEQPIYIDVSEVVAVYTRENK